MQVPLGVGGPGDQLAGLDLLPELDDRQDVPVREVADPDDALLSGLLRLHDAPYQSALERIDAVRPPRRRPTLGLVVAHRDVDPGVVYLLPARVEPRAAYRVLPVPRGDRPAAIVVGVPGPQLAPSAEQEPIFVIDASPWSAAIVLRRAGAVNDSRPRSLGGDAQTPATCGSGR